MKTKITLHGKLAKKFGESFEFYNIRNLKNTVSAINTINPEFKSYLIKQSQKGINYQIIVDGEMVQNVDNFTDLKPGSNVHFVPCILGADPISFIISLVINLIIAGIQYLMFPSEALDDRRIEASIKGESYMFASPDNLARQGQALPLGYGRLRVGSQIVNSSITTRDLNDNKFDNTEFGYSDNIKNQFSEFLNLSMLKNEYM
tara:strand:+ start:599 stop:1207 length:609 start_codon:yes stop_codon:yes gene_type:complete